MAAVATQRRRLYVDPRHKVVRRSKVDQRDALLVEHADMIRALNTPRTCLICNSTYHPATNLMHRSCRIHTGTISMYTRIPLYTCCGKYFATDGCRPCMHVYRQETLDLMLANPFDSTIDIPKDLVTYNVIECSPEIINDYPQGSPSTVEEEEHDAYGTRTSADPELFYHISMVAFFPGIKRSI